MKTVRVIRNAYHVLGLPTGVDLSEIKRRANHLLKLARIEETEKYETDLPGITSLRSEENIRKALEKLTAVKSRLIESFFWFETPTIQDYKSLKELTKGNIEPALSYWKGLSSQSPNWIAKKNEALGLFVSSYQTENIDLFEKSLLIWREIGTSNQFWLFYQEHYKITDDLGTDDKSFVAIRTNLFEYLSWLALDLYRRNPNPLIVKIFFGQTGVVGLGIEDHILNQIVYKVKMNLDSMGKLIKDDIRLRTAKVALMSSIFELSQYGVNDYSPIKVLRENCAIKLRAISIEINNDRQNYTLAKEFLDAGMALSNSESYLIQAKKDNAQLEKNHAFDNFVEQVVKNSEGKTAQAKWAVFKNAEEIASSNVKDDSVFFQMKRVVFIQYGAERFTASRDSIQRNNEDQGESGMNSIYNETLDLIEIFDLNKEQVQKKIAHYKEYIRGVSSPGQVALVDVALAEVWKMADESKLDEESKMAFVLVCQSVIWREFASYRKRLRYGGYLTTIGWFTVWFNGVGILFWIAAFLYRRKKF